MTQICTWLSQGRRHHLRLSMKICYEETAKLSCTTQNKPVTMYRFPKVFLFVLPKMGVLPCKKADGDVLPDEAAFS